jgi:hypothetical protein
VVGISEKCPPEPPFTASLKPGQVVPADDYRFTGPYTHANLSIFLIHGPATLAGKSYLTLQEALEQKVVVVHETGSVNQLAIENLSSEDEVYVQSGDIVKGGQQDRTFPYDFIAPSLSGQLAIDSFCVEQGRWQQRGDEKVKLFASSSNQASSNVKLAASGKSMGGQGGVWREVAVTQEKLEKKLGASARASVSLSSLQLSLENSELKVSTKPYLDKLTPVLEGKTDVIGYAVVINGKAVSADVYASESLFRKLWPKLLEGNAIEAFAELDEGKKVEAVAVDAVRQFLHQAEQGGPVAEAVTEKVFVLRREGEKQVMSDTCDRTKDNLVVHRCFLAR